MPKAPFPSPQFEAPVVLESKHREPIAVLSLAVFTIKVLVPTATQFEPVILVLSASLPTAVLLDPVVFA